MFYLNNEAVEKARHFTLLQLLKYNETTLDDLAAHEAMKIGWGHFHIDYPLPIAPLREQLNIDILSIRYRIPLHHT